jgi:hypothetical protein
MPGSLSSWAAIRVSNRFCAVEVRQFLARQVGGHVVHADGRFLVAFTRLVDAAFPQGDVVIGDVVRTSVQVLEHVHARATRIDYQRMSLARMQLQDGARQALGARALAQGTQAHKRFRAQIFDALAWHGLHDVAEGLQRSRARQQQVAADEVGEPEVRMLRNQLLDALQREGQAIALDSFDDTRQRCVGGGCEARHREGQRQQRGAQELRTARQFDTCSRRMRQRPSSDLTSSSVFVALPLNTSERYSCLKVTLTRPSSPRVTFASSTCTSMDFGAVRRSRRPRSQSLRGSPLGVRKSLAYAAR